MKKSLLILSLLFTVTALCATHTSVLLAQQTTLKDSLKVKEKEYGEVHLEVGGSNINSESIQAYLVAGNDTIHPSGNMWLVGFVFKKVPVGLVRAYAWADGYVTDADTLTVRKGEITKKNMYLTDRVIQMEAILVKGNIPAVVYRGDTIRFNPSNLNLSEDDMVRTILEQMPGVEITDNMIKVMGKLVEKTYVDGKKIFGENPMTAIDHVQGTDVVNIYAYDEDEHKEQEKKNRRGGRRRVLNIETKSKMINSQDGNLLAGAGGNLEKQQLSNHDLRYVAGGCFNFFSEAFLLSVNAVHNNQNRATNQPQAYLRTTSPSPIYSENSYGGFNLSHRWEQTPGFFKEVKGGYAFSRTASEQNRLTEQEYFPTESFRTRTYQSQSEDRKRDNKHTAQVGFGMNDKKWGRLQADYSFTANHSGNGMEQRIANRVDELTSNSLLHTQGKGTHRSMNVRLNWSQYFGNLQYTFSGNWNHNNSNGTEHRDNVVEESSKGTLQEVVDITTDGEGDGWGVTSKLQWNLPSKEGMRNRSIWGEYSLSKSDGRTDRLAWDKLTGEVDEANTYSYRNQSTTHAANLDFNLLNYEKWFFLFGFGWRHTMLEDGEQEALSVYQERFGTPTARAEWGISRKRFVVSLRYGLSSQLPNITQLRPEVSDDNPYFLISGNPNLKETTVHAFNLHHEFRFNDYGRMLLCEMEGSILQNSIANRTRYFKESTYLPDWNYTAMANSSFSSYENMNGAWTMQGHLTYSYPLDKIKSRANFMLSGNYEHTPYYYDEVRDVARIRSYNASVAFSTNLIPKTHISLNLGSNSQYASHKVNRQESRVRNYRIITNLNLKSIGKYGFARLYYAYRLRDDRMLHTKRVENVLNLYAGVKLFKRRGELSLTAYDLLRSYKKMGVTMRDNYTSFTESENYGRYFSVNFNWTFRKVKSNRMDVSRGVQW